ncbi:MAG: hypothetical protein EP340_10700 [Alphaproteobacteria bacterium]|nr:MAG: hypothetical protein EP340_10700 [Alphaproteobacteria bacterium]
MSDNKFATDLQNHKPEMNITNCMAAAKDQSGKSVGAQVREIWKLSRKPFKLSAQDYFYFGLYDDNRFSGDEKQRFIADRDHHSIIIKCCDPTWWALADDKYFSYTLLEANGAATPKTQAIFSSGTRSFGKTLTLRSTQELQDYLSSKAHFPLFVKPNAGVGSFGTFAVEAYDASNQTLQLAKDETIALDDFVSQIDGEEPYLFQTSLQPHADIAQICSGKVSTVRVIVILQDGQPEIIQTVWKIPGPDAIADNFWRKGNMLGAVDTETGKVTRVIRGYGPELEENPAHPATNQDLRGLTLPCWEEVKDLCLTYAPLFQKLRYQSWDVAITPEGPVVVEVNTGSAFNLSQLATGKGFMTDRFQAFLESCGYFVKEKK